MSLPGVVFFELLMAIFNSKELKSSSILLSTPCFFIWTFPYILLSSCLLYGSCKISLKRLKKGIPKVNCMLFLNHLDYMHGFGLFWKVTLWGLFLNRQNHCKAYWYWVIELWTHWKSKKKKSVYISFVNKSLQMTIAGSYELENTMGSQNEALPSCISNLITIP